MDWIKTNWRVVAAVAGVIAAIWVLVLIYVGITEAFAAAGALGAAVGAGAAAARRSEKIKSAEVAKERLNSAKDEVNKSVHELKAAEEEVNEELSSMSPEDKVNLGEELLK